MEEIFYKNTNFKYVVEEWNIPYPPQIFFNYLPPMTIMMPWMMKPKPAIKRMMVVMITIHKRTIPKTNHWMTE
jgi:hypothetical protein